MEGKIMKLFLVYHIGCISILPFGSILLTCLMSSIYL